MSSQSIALTLTENYTLEFSVYHCSIRGIYLREEGQRRDLGDVDWCQLREDVPVVGRVITGPAGTIPRKEKRRVAVHHCSVTVGAGSHIGHSKSDT